MNSRRKLLGATLASLALASVAPRARGQRRPRRIAFLWVAEQADYVPRLEAFKGGMRELGYIEGRDYTTEHRAAQNDAS